MAIVIILARGKLHSFNDDKLFKNVFSLPLFFIFVLPPTDLATLCPRVSDIISSRHFIARRQHLRFPPSCPGFESGRWFRVPLTFWIVFCQRTQETKLRKNLKKRLSRSMPSQMSFLQCNVTSLLFIRIKSSVFQNQITLISYFLTWFSEEEEKRRAKEEPESGGISWGMTDDDVEVSFPGTSCFSF